MTQRDPEKRLRISEYLDILSGRCTVKPVSSKEEATLPDVPKYPFPPFFDSFLYPLFLKMHWNGVTPDDRVNIVCEVRVSILIFTVICRLQSYGDLIRSISGGFVDDKIGIDFFSNNSMRSTFLLSENKSQSMSIFRGTAEIADKDVFTVGLGAGGALFDDAAKSTSVGSNSQRVESITQARLRRGIDSLDSPSVALHARYSNMSLSNCDGHDTPESSFMHLSSAELLRLAEHALGNQQINCSGLNKSCSFTLESIGCKTFFSLQTPR